MIQFPILRNDDVLQSQRITHHQSNMLEGKSLFELFLECDKIFEEFNYPCTLLILSEGIDVYPEWVEHIKKNLHRYKLELHGSLHYNYRNLSREQVKKELTEAKEKIEKTFGIKLTTWYMPFGRKGKHPDGDAICKELGLLEEKQVGKIDIRFWVNHYTKYGTSKFPMANFHYWDENQRKQVRKILTLWQVQQEKN